MTQEKNALEKAVARQKVFRERMKKLKEEREKEKEAEGEKTA